MKTLAERMKAAENADAEHLWKIIGDAHPEVISRATLNRNFIEEMAVSVAKNKGASSEVLGFLANDLRFKDSYALKAALCKNPKTPQRVTLSLLKFLRVFDLADLTRDRHIPVTLRQKIEQSLSERIKAMPSGIKTALARRASSSVVMALLEKGDEKVVRTCLDSPSLTEGHLYGIINAPAVRQRVIALIAEHPKWSLRYPIRFALIRNFFTPMTLVAGFIKSMKTADLKDLYSDPKLPISTKPFIFRELFDREETVEIREDEVFVLPEEEDVS